ncbi:GcrA family cell cycle regulator [Lutibaculum baratangense]|nr:GcrA family cell cycle regulator [Lutibaculum baratangense]
MSWTEERVELLKKLWTDGLSASQIASELGNVTRNAVIGKVHRLGLSGRAKAVRPTAPRPQKARRPSVPRPQAAVPQPAMAARMVGNTALKAETFAYAEPQPEAEVRPFRAPATVEEFPVPSERRATILDLNEHTCKWPIGDPTSSDFHFCGCRSKAGSPYCERHAAQAYQPVTDRRRKAH